MHRARLIVWIGVVIMILGSVWIANARSDRMSRAGWALDRAERLLQADRRGEAAAVLVELVKQQPNCVDAHVMLADLWSANGQDARALDHYRAVADLRPKDAQARYDLAGCCVAAHRYDVAERYLAQLLRKDPGDAHARRLLGFVRAQRDRSAQRYALRASAVHP